MYEKPNYQSAFDSYTNTDDTNNNSLLDRYDSHEDSSGPAYESSYQESNSIFSHINQNDQSSAFDAAKHSHEVNPFEKTNDSESMFTSKAAYLNDDSLSNDLNIRASHYGNMSVVDKMRGIQANRLNLDGESVSLAESYADSSLDKRVANGMYNVTITDIYSDKTKYEAFYGLMTDGKIDIKENAMLDTEIGEDRKNEDNYTTMGQYAISGNPYASLLEPNHEKNNLFSKENQSNNTENNSAFNFHKEDIEDNKLNSLDKDNQQILESTLLDKDDEKPISIFDIHKKEEKENTEEKVSSKIEEITQQSNINYKNPFDPSKEEEEDQEINKKKSIYENETSFAMESIFMKKEEELELEEAQKKNRSIYEEEDQTTQSVLLKENSSGGESIYAQKDLTEEDKKEKSIYVQEISSGAASLYAEKEETEKDKKDISTFEHSSGAKSIYADNEDENKIEHSSGNKSIYAQNEDEESNKLEISSGAKSVYASDLEEEQKIEHSSGNQSIYSLNNEEIDKDIKENSEIVLPEQSSGYKSVYSISEDEEKPDLTAKYKETKQEDIEEKEELIDKYKNEEMLAMAASSIYHDKEEEKEIKEVFKNSSYGKQNIYSSNEEEEEELKVKTGTKGIYGVEEEEKGKSTIEKEIRKIINSMSVEKIYLVMKKYESLEDKSFKDKLKLKVAKEIYQKKIRGY